MSSQRSFLSEWEGGAVESFPIEEPNDFTQWIRGYPASAKPWQLMTDYGTYNCCGKSFKLAVIFPRQITMFFSFLQCYAIEWSVNREPQLQTLIQPNPNPLRNPRHLFNILLIFAAINKIPAHNWDIFPGRNCQVHGRGGQLRGTGEFCETEAGHAYAEQPSWALTDWLDWSRDVGLGEPQAETT